MSTQNAIWSRRCRAAQGLAAIFPLQSLAAPTYRPAPRMLTPRQVFDLLSRNELLEDDATDDDLDEGEPE